MYNSVQLQHFCFAVVLINFYNTHSAVTVHDYVYGYFSGYDYLGS